MLDGLSFDPDGVNLQRDGDGEDKSQWPTKDRGQGLRETYLDVVPIVSLKEEVNHLGNILQIDGRLRRKREDRVLLSEVVPVERFSELKSESRESVENCGQ